MTSLTEQQIQNIKEEIRIQFQNEIDSLKNENIQLKNQINQLQQQQNISQNILKQMAAIFNQKSIQDLFNGQNQQYQSQNKQEKSLKLNGNTDIIQQKKQGDLSSQENFDSNSDSSDYEQNDAGEQNSDSENYSSQVEQALESPLNEKFEELYDIFYKKNNQKQAAKYIELIFQLVTEKNDPYALSWLGFSYLNGIKNMKNQKSGFQCFQEAAQQNCGLGFWGLGYCYLNGYGVEQNNEMALKNLMNGEKQQQQQCMHLLAQIYYNGIKGNKQDKQKAHNLWENLAKMGNQDAQNFLQKIQNEDSLTKSQSSQSNISNSSPTRKIVF